MVDAAQDFKEASMIDSNPMLLSSHCLPIPTMFRFNSFENFLIQQSGVLRKVAPKWWFFAGLANYPLASNRKKSGANSAKLLMRARKFHTLIYRLIVANQTLCRVKLSSMEYRLRRWSRPVPLYSQLPSNKFVTL
jgi:hypothetical protein